MISIPEGVEEGRYASAAKFFTQTLARLVNRVQRLSRRGKKAGDPHDWLHQIWDCERFQRELRKLQAYTESEHPKRRFAKYVCGEIGGEYVEARVNERELVLWGKKWIWPKTEADFKSVREILQRMSIACLDEYARILDEVGSTGAAAEIRRLKPKDRFRYYHDSQFDEAFRSHFGLKKPRKSGVKKAAKPKKIKARRRG